MDGSFWTIEGDDDECKKWGWTFEMINSWPIPGLPDKMNTREVMATIALLLHTPLIAVPFTYRHYSDRDPIQCRRPRLLAFFCTVMLAFNVEQLIQWGFTPYVSAAIEEIAASILLSACIETFLVFMFSLFVAFERMNAQKMALRQENIRRAHWHDVVLSPRFAVVWIGSVLLIQLTFQIIFVYYHPSLLTTREAEVFADQDTNGFALLQMIDSMANIPLMLMFVALSYRLRIVVDAFGIKVLNRKVVTACSIGIFLFTVMQLWWQEAILWGAPAIINVALGDYCLVVVGIIPIIQARRRKPIRQHNTRRSLLEQFLRIPEGFAAFEQHLEKECAIENLLFWRDALQFSNRFTEIDSKHAANLIYQRYLSQTAPLEVNLDSERIGRFRNERFLNCLREGDIQRDLFAETANEILGLMEVNSLGRFAETNNPVFTTFLAARDERKVFQLFYQEPRRGTILPL